MNNLLWNCSQRLLHKMAMVSPGGFSLRPQLHRYRGVKIGAKVWISQYVYIDEIHPESVSIGNNSSVGIRTSIITHLYWGPRKDSNPAGPICIEEDVFIGPHCVILPNVHIGKGSVISAGTVVAKNVPAHTLWSAPRGRPMAHVEVPLTAEFSYEQFTEGLEPWSMSRNNSDRT